jgi:hypothetical protein
VGFLSRLFGRGSAPSDGANVLWLYVRCARCGEKIRVRINRTTDAQQEYDESGRPTHYLLRKEILGNRCPNLMAVEMQLDNGGRIVEQQADRCVVIDAQEFEAG